MDLLKQIDSNESIDNTIPNELMTHLIKKSRKSKSIQLSPRSSKSFSAKDDHPYNPNQYKSPYNEAFPPFYISSGPAQQHFSYAFNFRSVNNVAPPPSLVSYHRHSITDALLSPDTKTTGEQVYSIFRD